MLYREAYVAQLEAGLRQNLFRWGLGFSAPLRLLAASENVTFLADDEPSGRRVVFRVYRAHRHGEAEIRSELDWAESLRTAGVVETPRLIPALDGTRICSLEDDGEVRLVVAFEHMSGRELNATDDLVKWLGRVGAMSAALHLQSRTWRRPAAFTRKTLDIANLIGPQAFWGDWREASYMTDDRRAVLVRAAEVMERQVRAYGCTSSNFGLIHADMHLANLLVDGERLGLIDFDDCGDGWFMFDFAASVSFTRSKSRIDDLKNAWVEGYRRVAPLPDRDVAMLPVFVMLHCIRRIAWIAAHPETATARARGSTYALETVELADRFLTAHS